MKIASRQDAIESEFFGHDWISFNKRNVDMKKHVLFGAIVPGNGLVELQWEKYFLNETLARLFFMVSPSLIGNPNFTRGRKNQSTNDGGV